MIYLSAGTFALAAILAVWIRVGTGRPVRSRGVLGVALADLGLAAALELFLMVVVLRNPLDSLQVGLEGGTTGNVWIYYALICLLYISGLFLLAWFVIREVTLGKD